MPDPAVSQAVVEHGPVVIEGFGVFIGIVAGALVQWLADIARNWSSAAEQRRKVRFEISYVLKKVAAWRELARGLRDAIVGDNTMGIVQYFDFTKAPLGASWNFVNSGKAYVDLGEDGLRHLLDLLATLSIGWENVVNNSIQQLRNNFSKQAGVMQCDFIDAKLRDIEKYAKEVNAALR